MKKLTALIVWLIAWLLIAAQSLAGITFHTTSGGGASAYYARVQTAASTFVAVQLPEGSSGGLGVYAATDANCVSGGLTAQSGATGFPYTIRVGTASTTANDAIVGYGTIYWDGTTEGVPRTTEEAKPKIWYVKSTGSDSNTGLFQSVPLLTVAQALTNAKDGDTIWLLNGTTTEVVSTTKRINWNANRTSSTTLTASTGPTLTLGSGSTVENLKVTNTYNDSSSGAIVISSLSGVSLKNVIASSTVGAWGVKVINSSNIRLSGVNATGAWRGLGQYDSQVWSDNGTYIGAESGAYIDSETVDSQLYTLNDNLAGSTTSATPVSGPTSSVVGGLNYETHGSGRMNHVMAVNPLWIASATHASFPSPVGLVIGNQDGGGTGIDLSVQGGSGVLSNSGVGTSYRFLASAGSRVRTDTFAQTAASNSGDVKETIKGTTAGYTLDIASTGEAGLDFANIKAASAPTTLTNITVPTVTTVGTLTAYTGNTPQTADNNTLLSTINTKLGTPSGASVSADVLNGLNRLPAALVSGRMDASVGDKTGFRLSAPGVDDIWDELLSGHTTAGSAGKATSDASAAGNPWSTTVTGNTTGGTFGDLLDRTYKAARSK